MKNKIVSITGGVIDPVTQKIAELTGGIPVDGFNTGVPDSEIAVVVVDCGGRARCGVYPKKRIYTGNLTSVGASGPLAQYIELNKIKAEGGECRYRKTKNIKKLEILVLKERRRLKNIRNNYIHQITASLVRTQPEYVVMESLNTSGMLKNRKLSKSIQEQLFHQFKRQIEYKCAWNGIKFTCR